MEAILKFNLPEDQEDFDRYSKSFPMALCLWDISQKLRSIMKYEDLTDEQYEVYEKFHKYFYEVLEEHDVNLDNLMS